MLHLNESFSNIIMNGVSDMVFIMKVNRDSIFTYHYLNHAALNNTTYNDRIIGKTIHEVNSKENTILLTGRYQNAAGNHTTVTYQDTHISNDGKLLYFDTTITPLVDQSGNCTHILAVAKDVSLNIQMTKKLAESEEHLQIIAENIGDLVTLINDEENITFASPSYKKIIGFDHKQFIGKHFSCNIHPDDQTLVNNKLTHSMTLREPFTVEFRQFNREYQWIWSASHGVPVFDKKNNLKHMVIVTRDISEQKSNEAQLEYFALHDSLTGLPNRRFFHQRLTKALSNPNDELAVIMLDIDNFKFINDEMGHDVGDNVIKEYGKRLSNTSGEKYNVARLGGDEFVVLLPNMQTVDQAIHIAKNIQHAIQKTWDINGVIPSVTTSIGIGIAKATPDTTPNTIMKLADIALYEAKNAGGNTYKINYAPA